MSRLVVLALLAAVAACGGEGKCANPPCQIPQPTCDSDADCFETELCDFQRNSCGASATDEGVCVRRPSTCTLELDRVCGCDGVFHDNPCFAAAAGTDLDSGGGCPVPAGAFACGARACDKIDQVCFDFGGSELSCNTFPQQCLSNRTCTCLRQFGCDECMETPDGGFLLRCTAVPDA